MGLRLALLLPVGCCALQASRTNFSALPAMPEPDQPVMDCFIGENCPDHANLTLVTVAAHLADSYKALLHSNRQRYAMRHCYESCILDHLFDYARPAAWGKVSAMRYLFDHARSVVAYIDADALFFDDSRTIESIATSSWNVGKDVVWTAGLAEDASLERSKVDTGVFICNNTAWSRNLWRTLWKMKQEGPEKDGWWVETALAQFRANRPKDFAQHSGIVGDEVMNQGALHEPPSNETFLYHFNGANPTDLDKWAWTAGYLRGIEARLAFGDA